MNCFCLLNNHKPKRNHPFQVNEGDIHTNEWDVLHIESHRLVFKEGMDSRDASLRTIPQSKTDIRMLLIILD